MVHEMEEGQRIHPQNHKRALRLVVPKLQTNQRMASEMVAVRGMTIPSAIPGLALELAGARLQVAASVHPKRRAPEVGVAGLPRPASER